MERTVSSSGDSHYYQIEVGGGEHLMVVLDADGTYNQNELYIRYGQLPNRDEYDDKYDLPNKPDQAVEIVNTQAGTYYVLVYCATVYYSNFSYTIAAYNDVTMPILVSGESVSGEMTDSNDARYYQVEVGGGEHLMVVLDADGTYNQNELYIRYGQLPNRDEYDDKYDLPNKPDQAVEIVNTQAGTYYVLVYCAIVYYSNFSYTIAATFDGSQPGPGSTVTPTPSPSPTPTPADTTGPTLTRISWTDADNSGGPTEGDTLRFDFSTAMDTSSLDSIDEINSRLDSSATGITDYGTTFTFGWNTGNTQLIVTLGPGVTIESGDRVNPTSEVTDASGNPDNTNPPGPAVPPPNSFTGSIPLPSELPTDPKALGTSASVAIVFVIIFYFAATLFNSTMRDNYGTIQGWLGFIERPINRVTGRLSRIESKRVRLLIVVGSVAIFALIYSFLDPYFTNGYRGLALFISLAIAIFIVTYTYEGIQVLLSGSSFNVPARLKILPIGILVAIVFVLLSRAIHFHPGLTYGFIGAYASLSAATILVKRQRAIVIVVGALSLITFSLIAFGLREFIPEASREGGGFWISLADGILAGIFVMGLEGLLFSFIPLTFMDGAKVKAWNKAVCVALLALVLFLFVWILILKDKEREIAEAARDMDFVMICGMMALFLITSLGTWLYFKARNKSVLVQNGNISEHKILDQQPQSSNLNYCTRCGEKIVEDSGYCGNCGQELMKQATMDEIRCPICGSETVIRTAKQGTNAGRQFHVCSRFPKCKGKIAIE